MPAAPVRIIRPTSSGYVAASRIATRAPKAVAYEAALRLELNALKANLTQKFRNDAPGAPSRISLMSSLLLFLKEAGVVAHQHLCLDGCDGLQSNAFKPLDDVIVACGAGAIALGFPVVTAERSIIRRSSFWM